MGVNNTETTDIDPSTTEYQVGVFLPATARLYLGLKKYNHSVDLSGHDIYRLARHRSLEFIHNRCCQAKERTAKTCQHYVIQSGCRGSSSGRYINAVNCHS